LIKRILLYGSCLLFLFSCTRFNYVKFANAKHNPVFDSYKKTFEDMWGQKVNVPISFGNLNKNDAGFCLTLTTRKVIVVDRKYWNHIDHYRREILILHELGHCVLGRGHYKENAIVNINGDICPKSIMVPSNFNSIEVARCYVPYRRYYLKELMK